MGRVYFPTRNDNGVRDLSKSVTLGGYLYTDYRGPAEPAAKAAMNPVNLGAIAPNPNGRITVPEYVRWMPQPLPPIRAIDTIAAPAVSSRSTPTPQVTVPPPPPATIIYVSSGGGTASPAPAAASPAVTQSPATSTITAAPGVADQVASWLSGTTAIGTWNIPNALLAGGVVLGFALLMGGGKRR